MKCYKYTMNLAILNIISIVIFIPLIGLIYFISPNEFINYFEKCNYILLFSLYFIWIIIHELLHYIGFIIDKEVNNKNVVMGILLEKSICYCMCKQLISKKRILISLLMPLIFIGIITLIIGIFINDMNLIVLSILNISGCSGDIMMFMFAVKLPNDIKYYDLDDPTSFNIMTNKEINPKPFGLKLMGIDDYNEEIIKAKENKKITISKWSSIILLILIIAIIVSIFMK